LLSALSHTLHGQLGGQFLTAMCMHLDGERGDISYAGAGHPPVLHWCAAERRLDSLASDGILISLVPSKYVSRRVTVASGDRLLLYTDGVLEAANNADEFFGDGRFHAVIAAHATRSGADLATAILAEMAQWAAHRDGFDDDVTLVVIEVQ
jgi:sigma-B regulation protein RsbU (phosphoserine phosphatase)